MHSLCLKISLFLLLSFYFFYSYAVPLSSVRWQPLPGTVALTFDDGPSPKYTPEVLAILKKYHVKATFFVMGWSAKKYSYLIREMIRDGHAVGIHTNSHPDMRKLTQKQLYQEVVMPKDVVAKIIGKPPVCLRPPYGLKNQRVEQYVRAQDLVLVPMGFNSFDYDRPGVEKITSWVVKNAIKGRVFLMHDGYDHRSQTVKALPGIIEGIRKKGLGFSAICYP